MKRGIWVTVFFLGSIQFAWAQSKDDQKLSSTEKTVSESPTNSYAVFGATPEQEAVLRSQIQLMRPDVQPLRIFFVPHWKYLDDARIFQLHVPTGYGSLMFTHLPSRTVFIDNDRYQGEEWLGYWMAHELGHLKTNSTKESDAERGAREFRKRLADSRKTSSRVQPGAAQTAVKN
jgi:3-deoxy-D-manno-octulosonic-acid transferase